LVKIDNGYPWSKCLEAQIINSYNYSTKYQYKRMENMEKLKYPIGRFIKPEVISSVILNGWIEEIEEFPKRLSSLIFALTDEQLDTRYRPGGWTLRQVVHHCADSHMNSFIRFKLALTEDTPTIKPYSEEKWAELVDGKKNAIDSSLQILEGLHSRWTILLRNLEEFELQMSFVHPENNKKTTIVENIGIYAWHCKHHLAHIESLKNRKGWR
jgi:hypothetical protein